MLFSASQQGTAQCCAQYRLKALHGFVAALRDMVMLKSWDQTRQALLGKVLTVIVYRFQHAGYQHTSHRDIAGSFDRASMPRECDPVNHLCVCV